jgi:phosphoribosylformylglycinamidine (FGAM) synthase PurS component
MRIVRCVEVRLTIPDNEAETARETLERLGVPLGALVRADLYRFELDASAEDTLVRTLSSLETIYNPGKHALRVREDAAPGPGEVWIDEIRGAGPAASTPVRIAGRELLGVWSVERFTAWRVEGAAGVPAAEAVRRATETLLCNPAFQRAIL